MIRKNFDYSLLSLSVIADTRELILCIVPVTNGYILIANILFLLRGIMLPDDQPMTAQQEFEEELKKNTVQEK